MSVEYQHIKGYVHVHRTGQIRSTSPIGHRDRAAGEGMMPEAACIPTPWHDASHAVP